MKTYVKYYKKLKKLCKNVEVNYNFKADTSFKVGGEVDVIVWPTELQEFMEVYLFLQDNNIPWVILGSASNVLIADSGFRGVIICTTKFKGIEQEENVLKVNAGTALNFVANYANRAGLGGLEDAFGIPGSVGGAIIMNASAYEFETSHVVEGVLCVLHGKITYLENSELEFEYRNSIFKKHKNCIVLRVDFKLTPNQDVDALLERSKFIMDKRKMSQPLDLPSAGSFFKRADNIIVSKLIDETGLKGYNVNGAKVSEKHAGFIVNYDNATAQDILAVAQHVEDVILQEHNVVLEKEVKLLGTFED